MLGLGALGEFALGEGPTGTVTTTFTPNPSPEWPDIVKKAGLSAAVIATTFVGFVPPPQAQAATVFTQFSQPVRKPIQRLGWQFVAPPALAQTAVFTKFSQPQAPRVNLPDEQPSTLFEVRPPPIISIAFSQFSQPQPLRSVIPDEQPSALFEILPPAPPPFTGFARFTDTLRAKSQVFLLGNFSGFVFVPSIPDTHDLVFMGDQFRKKKRKDPLDLEIERKARLRADLELAVYGPEVTYEPPAKLGVVPDIKPPPNVEDLAKAIMAAKLAHEQAQQAAIAQDDEDVIEMILRDL